MHKQTDKSTRTNKKELPELDYIKKDSSAQSLDEDQPSLSEDTRKSLKIKVNVSKWHGYVCERRNNESADDSQAKDETDEGSPTFERGGMGLDSLDERSDISSSQTAYKRSVNDYLRVRKANKSFFDCFGKTGNGKVNLGELEIVLNKGANINCVDQHKQTILHEVARAWRTDAATFLIEKGADVNAVDAYGRTPLHIAATTDNADMVALLIQNGAEKEAKTQGDLQTPAHLASKYGSRKSLKVMLDQGGDVRAARDYKERTPLDIAAEYGRCETAKLLLSWKAPVHNVQRECGKTSDVNCLTRMITKMPAVAYKALDDFRTVDHANRKEKIYLNRLIQDDLTQGPLFAVVTQYRYNLIMHPCFLRLIDVMWTKFGRKRIFLEVLLNLFSTILWTVIGVAVEYDERHIYVFPRHAWRVILPLIAIGITIWQIIFEERMELKGSMKSHKRWVDRRRQEITRDMAYCHPRWPQEHRLLQRELNALENVDQSYFADTWNIFDWTCYTLLVVSIVTHLFDIGLHSERLARWHIRIMCATIILLWCRLLKTARAFSFLGPFIVMLGHILVECLRFLFFYLEFYIPYVCAFWMIFGGDKLAETDIDNESRNESVIVNGFQYPGQALFSVFRMTLIDDYDFDNMYLVDSVMATLLVWTWLAFSAIICLNLLIALMSETFKRIYDNAKSNSVMQRAITLLSLWDKMGDANKQQFMNFIATKCSPMQVDFFEDLSVNGEVDLKKVTFQIKEQLEDMQVQWNLQFGQIEKNSVIEDAKVKKPSSADEATNKQLLQVIAETKSMFKREINSTNHRLDKLTEQLMLMSRNLDNRDTRRTGVADVNGEEQGMSITPGGSATAREINIEVQPVSFSRNSFPDLSKPDS